MACGDGNRNISVAARNESDGCAGDLPARDVGSPPTTLVVAEGRRAGEKLRGEGRGCSEDLSKVPAGKLEERGLWALSELLGASGNTQD